MAWNPHGLVLFLFLVKTKVHLSLRYQIVLYFCEQMREVFLFFIEYFPVTDKRFLLFLHHIVIFQSNDQFLQLENIDYYAWGLRTLAAQRFVNSLAENQSNPWDVYCT